MRYRHIVPARFRSRPNRFIAMVDVDGREVVAHVKNTGRCRELLVPGAEIWLEESGNPARKTKYDLVAVKKGGLLINMDSQAPNAAAGEYLRRSRPDWNVRAEVKQGESRFDFCLTRGEERVFIEVKGVTLERDGVVLFPDAPTERGAKHLRELAELARQGVGAEILFVIQFTGGRYFTPNRDTDPGFAEALRAARDAGVKVRAVECRVTPETMEIAEEVDVRIE